MAGSRTLKLSILADIDNLQKNLNAGSNEVEGFSGKLEKFGKMAGAAFAAAGVAAAAYAGKLLVDGVKSAIEDEAAQQKLAIALRNVTGATDKQIKSTEDWITKQGIAFGVTDDQLRPALERLTRSTKDVEEAQSLASLALDIAGAKGRDVEVVANALAKANDGQTAALKKLGITLGDNANNYQEMVRLNKALEKAQSDAQWALEQYGPKAKEYEKALTKVADAQQKVTDVTMQGIDWQGELAKEFAGGAAEAADTFQGKMLRLSTAFDEAKETVGSYVLDAITPMVTVFVEKVLPVLQDVSTKLGKSLGPAFEGIKEIVQALMPVLKLLGAVFMDVIVPILGKTASAISKVIEFVSDMVSGISSAIKKIAELARAIADSAVGKAVGGILDAILPGRAAGGPVTGGSPYIVGEKGPELFVPNTSGRIVPNNALTGGSQVFNITVNGAIDSEGTARTIYNLLRNSAARGNDYSTLGMAPLAV